MSNSSCLTVRFHFGLTETGRDFTFKNFIFIFRPLQNLQSFRGSVEDILEISCRVFLPAKNNTLILLFLLSDISYFVFFLVSLYV